MSEDSSRSARKTRTAKWIAAGFLGAFAASILTVIYTGLNVEGSSAEFDAGFRPITLSVGQTQTVELQFDSPRRFPDAMLEISLPTVVELAAASAAAPDSMDVEIAAGANVIPVQITALEPGSGYLVARVKADDPIGLYRVFVTVTDE